MKTIFLAGGLGTRISEETKKIPKPMIKIGKLPILFHIMKHYSNYHFKDFIVCAGYKHNFINNFFRNKKNFSNKEKDWKINVVNTGDRKSTRLNSSHW